MKKNKTMRAAGGLLIATLLSTSVVSGTFAKYVTTADTTDTARVAKFGVEVKSTGGLFAETYKTTANTPGESTDKNEGDSIALSVVSSDDDNVVAPGTKSDANGLSFSVTGTPEVAVKVDFKFDTDNLSDIWLGTGTYPNLTTSAVYDNTYDAATDVFTIAEDTAETNKQDTSYYPIKYTLVHKYTANNASKTETTTGNLQKVVDELKKYESKTYAPGTDLSKEIGTFTLTWEWAFGDTTGVTGNDTKDTFLGDAAADNGLIAKAVTAVNGAIDTENKAITAENEAAKQANSGATEKASITKLETPTEAKTGTKAEANKYNTNVNLGLTISVTQVD